jgi:large subunit ribosomal protein L10
MKDDTKKSSNRIKKEEIVAKLSEKADKSEGIIFADYQGLTHQQLEGLRREAKKLDAEFITAKNSLFLLALSDKIDEASKNHFNHPTGALFMRGDIIQPLKALSKLIKELDLPKIKFGLLNGKSISSTDVIKLANLPPLPTIQAQLLGTMMSPVSGLHRALSWNISKLVLTLSTIKSQKSS